MTDPITPDPVPVPDEVRRLVRTGMQAAWGFAFALLARLLADKLGFDISGLDLPVQRIIDGASISVAAILWMTVVRILARYPLLAWVEHAFILKGDAHYIPPGG